MNFGNNDNKLSFEEGLMTLKSMFNNFEDGVIITVLEENDFKMEETIECLLNLQNNFENIVPNQITSNTINTNNQGSQNIIPVQNIGNNAEQCEKEEKILSLFNNVENNTGNQVEDEINNEYLAKLENLQRICIENNIPMNDIGLMEYYMNNPEFLFPDGNNVLPKSNKHLKVVPNKESKIKDNTKSSNRKLY